ncbi:DUF1851 domain-containing protein [Reinekea marina]|uniref:T6SS immunity protein Tdi1 domain-containing protein n=1 Tax=Reinekea marina TaxID=1310421 RepID=A0ABV7WLQ0_9GAMM|nr:T6SS immunity protein Tdi1 domain-containing protein [Reinekea marina]MDN3650802.1 DUF1851 domain-containing protein [Reinekea marina]
MPFIREITQNEIEKFLPEWSWLVPSDSTPLFITAFGDWVFGNPDGSLSLLSVLDGVFERIAENSNEYNKLKNSEEWLDEIFIASWYQIAIENGVIPNDSECIGWKIHPAIGGEFKVGNLQVFDSLVYQSLMSQLHAKIQSASTSITK